MNCHRAFHIAKMKYKPHTHYTHTHTTHTHIHTHTHTHTRTHTGGGTKQATLETGALVQVPAFIDAGTKIRVDTRTKTYLGKAN